MECSCGYLMHEISSGGVEVKQVWRLLAAVATMGVIWAVCEYVSVTAGVVTVAGMVALSEVTIRERFDQIGRALEMHSRKVFPELWN